MRNLAALLSVFVAGSLFIACYAPNFASPGYYCDPEANPSCPEGQDCVNGRCVSERGGNGNDNEDLRASDDPIDLKGADFKSSDLKKPPADFSNSGGGANTCGGYIDCFNDCTSDSCVTLCQAELDSDGTAKIQAAIDCLYEYCEFTAGDCEYDFITDTYIDPLGAPSGACDACVGNAASDLTGQPCQPTNDPNCSPSVCASTISTCLNDT